MKSEISLGESDSAELLVLFQFVTLLSYQAPFPYRIVFCFPHEILFPIA